MRILTYGTFDLFHRGHLWLLARANSMGDSLFVGLSTDKFNREKGKNAYFSFDQRKTLLYETGLVDYVFAEDSWNQKQDDIARLKVDCLLMGSDWQGKFDYLRPYCSVVYLPRTENVSSSEIREEIKC